MAKDNAMYTGVDEEPKGIFENEAKDKDTQNKILEQDRLMKELTPKLQDLIDKIDEEIKLVMSIDNYANATTTKEEDVRAELRAAFLYKKYLEGLKTKFVLALGEVKKGK